MHVHMNASHAVVALIAYKHVRPHPHMHTLVVSTQARANCTGTRIHVSYASTHTWSRTSVAHPPTQRIDSLGSKGSPRAVRPPAAAPSSSCSPSAGASHAATMATSCTPLNLYVEGSHVVDSALCAQYGSRLQFMPDALVAQHGGLYSTMLVETSTSSILIDAQRGLQRQNTRRNRLWL